MDQVRKCKLYVQEIKIIGKTLQGVKLFRFFK